MKKIICVFLAFCLFFADAAAFSYTIVSGDTISLIARKYNITESELLAANPQVTNPNYISVGQVLEIPAPQGSSVPKGRDSLTYLYGGTTSSYLKILNSTNDSIRTICPDYFDITEDGRLLITPSNKIDQSFVDALHYRGFIITPFISNHWDKDKGNAALNNREALATQVAAKIIEHNLDGINVDIENVNEKYRAAYTDFVRLLRQKLPPDKIVTVAVAANPKNWQTGWHGSYDYKALSDNSDYLMLMTYDESYQGGPAGPISSKQFFEDSISYALNKGVPKEKIIAGLPFFGRYWKSGSATGGYGISDLDIDYLVENYSTLVFYHHDTQSCNAVVTISESDPKPKLWGGQTLSAGTYSIWYDNVTAIKYKLKVIDDLDLRGAGSWALGQESKTTWSVYTGALNGKSLVQDEGEAPAVPGEGYPDVARIIELLRSAGDQRALSENTRLTRGEAAVILAKISYVEPESGGAGFSDTAYYWGGEYLNALKRRRLINGYNGDTFAPDRLISREEMVTLLDRTLVLPSTIDYHEVKFRDVAPERWSYNAVSRLHYFDILRGFDEYTFKPADNLTVLHMAFILDRILRYEYPFNPNQYMGMTLLRGKPPEAVEPILEPR